jgi:hypothetical protein
MPRQDVTVAQPSRLRWRWPRDWQARRLHPGISLPCTAPREITSQRVIDRTFGLV